jgi:hypothetical protein
MSEDGRRAQYVPVDTGIAFGKTATRLKKKFGRDGLLTWVLFLAACKRSREQGTFTYTSESEGWQLIGLDYPDTPTFSLDQFFAFTGRGGGTRLVRSGAVRRVSVVKWKTWNDEWKKQQGAERMSFRRQGEVVARSSLGHGEVSPTSPEDADEVGSRSSQNPRTGATNTRTQDAHSAHDASTEVEVEVDLEVEDEVSPVQLLEAATDRAGLSIEDEARKIEERLERQAAIEGPSARLLEQLDDVDEGTPAVIRSMLERLPDYATAVVIHELQYPSTEIRSRTRYAVGLLKRMLEPGNVQGRKLHAFGRVLRSEAAA